uniref:Ig-like domain-containing protein n=1 Tax=Lepisosteus oculatus TaxID=7918 RepID=W5MYT9_LEPOC
MTRLWVRLIIFISTSTGVIPENVVNQPHLSVTAGLGGSVSLECFIFTEETLINWVWFKQVLGHPPRYFLTSFGKSDKATFYSEFEDTTRFTMKKMYSQFTLTISQVQLSDVATYYCGFQSYTDVQFGNGTTLLLTGSESRNSVCEASCVSQHSGEQLCLHCVSAGAPCSTSRRILGSANTTHTAAVFHDQLFQRVTVALGVLSAVLLSALTVLLCRKTYSGHCQVCKGVNSENTLQTNHHMNSEQGKDTLHYTGLKFSQSRNIPREKTRGRQERTAEMLQCVYSVARH